MGLARSEMLDFQIERAPAYATYGGAAVGELLSTVADFRRRGGDRPAWVAAWHYAGRHAFGRGQEALDAGHRHTARSQFLRSYNYLRSAEFFFDRLRDGAVAHRELYEESVASFDAALPLFDFRVEKVAVPYEGDIMLPGYFFACADRGTAAPTVILSGGGDGFGEESYFFAGVPEALRRGLNVLVFHGPGQRGVLHRHPDLTFRQDSETVFAALLDFIAARPDVDPARVALYGVSFGGYLASRAAARDHRYAALVANAPIRDMRALMTAGILDQVPAALRGLVARHLNRAVAIVTRRDWSMQAAIENSMLWTTAATTIEDFLHRCGQFTLDSLETDIRCPTL
ncbi:dipeptidyl aminopeptidase [Micromonospora qiuiae]|uniref:Dipeptidyl aminopeptidase n=1 Tax=Micromonospora qiuiae TaxID=502268 RepID=A0ABQ4JHW8_9ACTN|nr:dipeptidyl aminopeptidase [Micromonospora qiuiae]